MMNENDLARALMQLQNSVEVGTSPRRLFVSPSMVEAARKILNDRDTHMYEIEVEFDAENND